MLSLTFHFLHAIISLQLKVGPIITWMVVLGVSGLEYKWVDVVVSEKICGPIINVAVMDAKEEYLWIELAISTGNNEETHCLCPDIPVHISQRSVVDYPVTK